MDDDDQAMAAEIDENVKVENVQKWKFSTSCITGGEMRSIDCNEYILYIYC